MESLLLQDWKFHFGDVPGADYRGFDDSPWDTVIVPHDWSVSFPFSEDNSSGTGYLPGGIGWYRTTFTLPKDCLDKKKTVTITFDGVYNNSQVWCNGYNLGKRPYGYSTFTYDITDFISWDRSNTIAVRVAHEDIADSRWFTGSGIYRKVSVEFFDSVHIPWDGLFFTTPQVSEKEASINIANTVVNKSDAAAEVTVTNYLKDQNNSVVLSLSENLLLQGGEQKEVSLSGQLDNPQLWSPASPSLYTLESVVESTLSDNTSLRFQSEPLSVGIRWFTFDPNKGFFLNGDPMKIKGVCVHHDAGTLGAAVWPEVWQRRLEKLQDIGCNAIRMAHNPHMKELYHLCDQMGFFVMDEAFDEWEGCKNKWWQGHNVYPPKRYGYSEDFPVWHALDLSELIKRNRNHPSIIFWSVGNEIDYPNDPYCHPLFTSMEGNNDKNKPQQEMMYDPDKPNAERLSTIAANLTAIVRQHDTTRPVLAACAFPELSTKLGFTDTFDVVGYNYKEHLYEADHKHFPNKPILGSENNHGWEEWKAVRDNEYISGQFLWTGFDYLGETSGWPYHGSTAGILTTAGFGKTDYYRRDTFWSDTPKTHLFTRPSSERPLEPWSFQQRWDYLPEQSVQVISYTNTDTLELFINDVSYGTKARNDNEAILWTVPFARGEIQVRSEKGEVLDSISSLLPAAQLTLTQWKPRTSFIFPGAYEIHQLIATVSDENGRRCIEDSSLLQVTVEGDGILLGIENGDLADTSDYALPRRRVMEGRAIVYILTPKDKQATVSVVRNNDLPVVLKLNQ